MQSDVEKYCCGIDFGTSNSTVCLATEQAHFLAAVENRDDTIPSAMFFNFATGHPAFGREAIRDYMAGESGRFMRALKSVIGRPIFHEKTKIGKRYATLAYILGLFLQHLKRKAEAQVDRELESVVLGRPVQFIENAPEADRQAQSDLEAAARKVGFKNIEFQFEPIAAALEYETSTAREQVVLIVDIGGGTSDFSIVRVSPERITQAERSADILANRGIRVGGTDFDRLLSTGQIMPHFGRGSLYGSKKLEMPKAIYWDLSTWSNINSVYEHKVLASLRSLRKEAQSPALLDRLVSVIESRSGHRLISDIERAKIALSSETSATVDLGYVESGFAVSVSRDAFVTSIAELLTRIETCIRATLADAGLAPERINTVFLTGGSSMALPVQALVRAMFAQATITSGDVFGAVGKGLGLDAKRKFG